MDREVTQIILQLHRERDLPLDQVIGAFEEALLSGYRIQPGADPLARVVFDLESAEARILTASGEEALGLDGAELAAVLHDEEGEGLEVGAFGRSSVMAVRRAMRNGLRRAEEAMMMARMAEQIGDALLGTVRMVQFTSRRTLVDLGHGIEGVIPAGEQVDGERHRAGQKLWAALVSVEQGRDGLEVVLSRRSPDLVRGLLEVEIPEVADGQVEIVKVVRRAGYRTKVGVRAEGRGQDPVGAIIGPRGARVRALMRELGQERIDVVNVDHDPVKQISRAIQPAKPRQVHLDMDARSALVVVPDEELGRAIGPEGANARLAARLTGWQIRLRAASTHAAAGDTEEAAADGLTCAAQRANGRRCPNAPESGSSFCGLHTGSAAAA